MIGFLMRGVGISNSGSAGACLAGVAALCAIFGIYKCLQCQLRDCRCLKWLLKKIGVDSFEDFDLRIIVHEATLTSAKSVSTCVRITVGNQQVVTETDDQGKFHQHVSIRVEQGSECVLVELMESRGKQVLAGLELDLVEDILGREQPVQGQVFDMSQKSKGIRRPRIRLTILHEGKSEEEKRLLSDLHVSESAGDEVNNMVFEQLRKTEADLAGPGPAATSDESATEAASPSKKQILTQSNSGPLQMLCQWGTFKNVNVSIKGPGTQRKYKLCIWDSDHDPEKGHKPAKEIDLMRIASVQPDPHHHDGFVIFYGVDPRTQRKDSITFKRVDRPRDVWVEMLSMQIKIAREERSQHKPKNRR